MVIVGAGFVRSWPGTLPRTKLQEEEILLEIFMKLDRVGPVDYRPSNDKLHYFALKKSGM